MNRILVVYCSRSGRTETVARLIAAKCGADIEAIEDVSADRSGVLGYLRCALEALFGIQAPIRRNRCSPRDYDLVIVGTPVWFWNMSSPVRTYLNRHGAQMRQVAFFCTLGGSGQDKVIGEMAQLCGKPALATLALLQHEVDAHMSLPQVARFAKELDSVQRGQRRGAQAMVA